MIVETPNNQLSQWETLYELLGIYLTFTDDGSYIFKIISEWMSSGFGRKVRFSFFNRAKKVTKYLICPSATRFCHRQSRKGMQYTQHIPIHATLWLWTMYVSPRLIGWSVNLIVKTIGWSIWAFDRFGWSELIGGSMKHWRTLVLVRSKSDFDYIHC